MSSVRRGFSLLDIMMAIIILAVVIIGTINYRYYAVIQVENSMMQSSAARIGVMMVEGWRGIKGVGTYNPVTAMTPASVTLSSGPAKPSDFTLLGSYLVQLTGRNYYVTLSYKDVDTRLRALNVVVTWSLNSKVVAGATHSFKITTYTAT